MLAALVDNLGLVDNFEQVMAEGPNPQEKEVLRRVVKKVVVHDRRTIEVWYGLPNCGGIEHWKKWLPACNSSRRGRTAWAEPEIWFRIVHIALNAPNGGAVAAYCEQTLEIALGPKGSFEKGNIGTLTRRVPAERVVSALPRRRSKPKPPREPKAPRVADLLHKAIEWRRQLHAGEVRNQAEIARQEGITRARVTQVMGLLRLAPEIQQQVLSLPDMVHRPAITERALRPIARIEDHKQQMAVFSTVLGQGAVSKA